MRGFLGCLLGFVTFAGAAVPLAGAAPVPRDGDLVAPPMSLGRLRVLLEECVSPPPTPGEWSIVVALHRDMVRDYGAAMEGAAGDRWREGNTLYDELRNMRKDPSRDRIKEIIDLQDRMLADADAAERTMFDHIAGALEADEPDDPDDPDDLDDPDSVRRLAVRDGVARARDARVVDRTLTSLPMEEPSGVRLGLRDAVARLGVDPEVRAQLLKALAFRDAQLGPLLRTELRDYRSFAIATAAAFEKVFGGVLPPIGAIFSDEEAQRLRARMLELCADEGERFLRTRRSVRALEDSTIEQMCAVLPPDAQIELRLRLTPSIGGWGHFLISTEGAVRDALADLPADDPVRAAVAEFAPRWQTELLRILAKELVDLRAQEDDWFWKPGPLRGSFLALQGMLGVESGSQRRAELDRILAPRVADAGGKLGHLVAERGASGQARLLQRDSLTAWEAEMPPEWFDRSRIGDALEMTEWFFSFESQLSEEHKRTSGIRRRGIPPRMPHSDTETRLLRGLDAASAAILGACIAAAWVEHEARWEREVETAIAPLTQARDALGQFKRIKLSALWDHSPMPEDAPERTKALRSALAIRDNAWRGAEAIDEAFFDSLSRCAPADSVAIQQGIALARLRRFTERERRSCQGVGFVGSEIEPYPQWETIVDRSGLDAAAAERVRSAIVRQARLYAAASVGVRLIAFDGAGAGDALHLGLRDGALHQSLSRRSSETSAAMLRASRGAADMLQAMLDAATDGDGDGGDRQRALLESAILDVLYSGWQTDRVAQRTARLAEGACRTDEERAQVAHAHANYLAAVRASCERGARLALARSAVARTTDGRVLFPMPASAAEAGSPEQLKERTDREFVDLRASFDIEVMGILGRERWKHVAPPDLFELLGVGGRR